MCRAALGSKDDSEGGEGGDKGASEGGEKGSGDSACGAYGDQESCEAVNGCAWYAEGYDVCYEAGAKDDESEEGEWEGDKGESKGDAPAVGVLNLDYEWNGVTKTRLYSEVIPACAPTGLVIALHGAGGEGAHTCADLYEVASTTGVVLACPS